MIAVMGAAGHVGSKVANLLLGAGENVRVLQHARDLTDERERRADVVTGDAMNVSDLRRLLSAALAALVLLPENLADPSFVDNRKVMSRASTDVDHWRATRRRSHGTHPVRVSRQPISRFHVHLRSVAKSARCHGKALGPQGRCSLRPGT